MEVNVFHELEDFLDPFLDPQYGPVRPDRTKAGKALIVLDALIKHMPGVTEDRVCFVVFDFKKYSICHYTAYISLTVIADHSTKPQQRHPLKLHQQKMTVLH